MKSITSFIKNKIVFLGAIVLATFIGGMTATLVRASVPSSNGMITACYKNNGGDLSIVDVESGATCSNKETQINWSQYGGGPNAYAFLKFDSNTFTFSVDNNRSKNVVNYVDVSPTNYACMQVSFTPKNILTSTNLSEIGVKDENGWAGSQNASVCDSVTNANVYFGYGYGSNEDTFMLIH